MFDKLRNFQMNPPPRISYISIKDEEGGLGPETSSLTGRPDERSEPSSRATHSKWMYLSIFLASLNVIQFVRPFHPTFMGSQTSSQQQLCQDFSTDFPDARKIVSFEQREYTGWISYNSTTNDVYRVFEEGEPIYFGEPSAEMDTAWDELLKGQYVAMTDEEAAMYPGIVRSGTTGNYHMQPDVYHSLHCLNSVRQELEPEYYKLHPRPDADVPVPPSWGKVHRDHCLDQIRQSLQCQADLSPAPFAAWEGFHLSIAEGRTHTCRNWDSVRNWVLERDMRSPSVPGD